MVDKFEWLAENRRAGENSPAHNLLSKTVTSVS